MKSYKQKNVARKIEMHEKFILKWFYIDEKLKIR